MAAELTQQDCRIGDRQTAIQFNLISIFNILTLDVEWWTVSLMILRRLTIYIGRILGRIYIGRELLLLD